MGRWPEILLVLGGVLLLASSAGVHAERERFQRELDAAFQADLAASEPAAPGAASSARRSPRRPPVAALGRIEIPSIGVRAIIAEGTADRTLDRAVGHVRGTALPGERGNVSLAGHRDTFFKRLRGLEPGDEIRITTRRGRYAYRVVATTIVGPERTDLMRSTRTPTLTLITCYPFNAIGPAPKRFVVRARAEA